MMKKQFLSGCIDEIEKIEGGMNVLSWSGELNLVSIDTVKFELYKAAICGEIRKESIEEVIRTIDNIKTIATMKFDIDRGVVFEVKKDWFKGD